MDMINRLKKSKTFWFAVSALVGIWSTHFQAPEAMSTAAAVQGSIAAIIGILLRDGNAKTDAKVEQTALVLQKIAPAATADVKAAKAAGMPPDDNTA